MLSNVSLSAKIFLPVILAIGIITSYEDLKVSRIKNKWVITGLAYSFFAYSVILIIYALCSSNVLPAVWINRIFCFIVNLDRWAINLLASVVLAYLLWYFKMWGAGDAKLFICYAALTPIGVYSRVYFGGYFASFMLLLTIFIPATVYLFFKAALYFIKRFDSRRIIGSIYELIKAKLDKLNVVSPGKIILGFFVFFLFFRILRTGISGFLSRFLFDQNILVLFSLFMFRQLSKFFKNNAKFMLVLFIALVVYVIFQTARSQGRYIFEIMGALKNAFLIMVFSPLFKKITDLYIERTDQKTTHFALWMFLGALLVWFI